ncbi:MAG: pyridoxamine 5'-phosphate oxidase [Pseudomonadota bacterium]
MADDTAIPASPSASDYGAEADRPLIPDTSDPIALLTQWLAEARETELNDSNAMSLATVDETGLPDVRVVLLKGISEDGLSFFTNFNSTKGQQLAATPAAALGFHWKSLRRQVRLRGTVSRLPEGESDAYFASRAPLSRISAIASDQSQPLPSRDAFLARTQTLQAQYENDDAIPRPAHWGGFLLSPTTIEFWQDQAFRMHDRLKFDRDGDHWTRQRLYP